MKKKYTCDIVFFTIMFILSAAMILTGNVLKISRAYVLGVVTGITFGCIICIIKIIKKKKSIAKMDDERVDFIKGKSAQVSLAVIIIILFILGIASRSKIINFNMALSDFISFMVFGIICIFGICYFIISRLI